MAPFGVVEPGEDPVPGFLGGKFAREGSILFGLIEELWQAGDEAKRNVPPHVQAARQLENPGRWVSYVITGTGPQPVTGRIPHPDYAHYRDRQIAAAADGILHFLNTSFDAITNRQMAMFD